MMRAALLLLGVTAVAPSPAPRRVAVIGAGIGGGAFAHFFKLAHPDAEVVVYEARDYIGGRLKHTTLHNQTVELGGDAWSEVANPYVVALAKELGVRRARSGDGLRAALARLSSATGASDPLARAVSDPLKLGVGVWDGHRLVDLEALLLRNPGAVEKGLAMEGHFLASLHRNYKTRGDSRAFKSIPEFLHFGPLEQYTSVSAVEYYDSLHISPEVQRYFMEPLTRVIYDQSLRDMQAFSAVVAVTSLLGADSFDGKYISNLPVA